MGNRKGCPYNDLYFNILTHSNKTQPRRVPRSDSHSTCTHKPEVAITVTLEFCGTAAMDTALASNEDCIHTLPVVIALLLGVGVGVTVKVGVGVGVRVGVTVGVGVRVGVAVGVSVKVGVGVNVRVAVAVGAGKAIGNKAMVNCR